MEKNESQNSKIRKIIILVAIGLLLLAIPLGYFFSWRPADNDYAAANDNIKTMRSAANLITVELALIPYPGIINQNTPVKLRVLSEAYKKAYQSLKENAAINRDFTLGPLYNRHKDTFAKYDQFIDQLTESIDLYVSALNECKKVTDSFLQEFNQDNFNTLMDSCQKAIDKGKSAPHAQFKDQFLSEYLDKTSNYMALIKKMTTATTNDETDIIVREIDKAYEEISKLGEIKLQFNPPNTTQAYDQLSSVLDSQKKAFWR